MVILLPDYTDSILQDGSIHLAALRKSYSHSPNNDYHVYNQPKLRAKFPQEVLFLLFCNRKSTYLNTPRPAEHCPFHIISYFRLTTRCSERNLFLSRGVPVSQEHLLIPQSNNLIDKLTCPQIVKKFPAIYGTRRFTTAFASARHLCLP
jgi:hypothetical protein